MAVQVHVAHVKLRAEVLDERHDLLTVLLVLDEVERVPVTRREPVWGNDDVVATERTIGYRVVPKRPAVVEACPMQHEDEGGLALAPLLLGHAVPVFLALRARPLQHLTHRSRTGRLDALNLSDLLAKSGWR